jgi:hypothetical protein
VGGRAASRAVIVKASVAIPSPRGNAHGAFGLTPPPASAALKSATEVNRSLGRYARHLVTSRSHRESRPGTRADGAAGF